MFALEHFGMEPDLLVMAKGLASGFQLSAIAGRPEILDDQTPGAFVHTPSQTFFNIALDE